MTLRARPKSWLSGGFDIYDRGGALLGGVDLSSWRERAALEIGGARYEASHKAGKKEFRLRFEYGGNGYELSKESAWKRDSLLTRDGVGEVGSVRPGSLFERSWTAELPEELPPEAKAFVLWLVALLWKRQDSAGGSAG